jgi:hypothetical protein
MKLDFDCDLSQFERDLTKLGIKASTTITARALRAGGAILAEAQRDHAPILTEKIPGSDSLEPGAVKDDIQTMINIDGVKGVAQAIVGPGYETDYVVNWLEKGHEMVSHGKKRNRTKIGKKGFVDPVNDGEGFMRPAYEASAQAGLDKALDVMADGISEELDAGGAE